MDPKPIRRLALLGAALLALAACGGSGAEPAPTLPSVSSTVAAAAAPTTTAPDIDPEEAFQEYSECMREHGVEMPDPDTGGGGGVMIVGEGDFDISAFEEAAEACDPILEDVFGEFEMTPEMEAELRDQELAFARCMRDNGVEDWPDPSGDLSGGMSIQLPDDLDPEKMNAAMEICSKETFGTSGGMIIGGQTP